MMASFMKKLLAACGLAFAAGTALPEHCDAASVGAGWAGIYYAFRLSQTGVRVCIFEASDRVGGRTYSHSLKAGTRNEEWTLDVGAYRFTPDMHLPGDIILKVLGLNTACYEPSCEPASKDFPPPFMFNYTAPLRRIVDDEGLPAGYVKALDGMLQRIQAAGGQLFMQSAVTDLQPLPNNQGATLFIGDKQVTATRVLLNLPRNHLLKLASLKANTPARTVKMQECVKFDIPTNYFPPNQTIQQGRSLTKAYAFYEDAWWHTKLNKTDGQWPENAFLPLETPEDIPIGIHWNDGPVRCDAPLKGCRGFIEVFYATAFESFFEDLRRDPYHPLGMLFAADDKKGRLQELHAAIMDATKPVFDEKHVAQPTEPPTALVVGVWDRRGHGYTAPTKVYYSTNPTVPGGPDPLERACGVPGLTDSEYRESVLSPLGTHSILVANNDWVAQSFETMFGDWAEESLLQTERGLSLQGFGKPQWLDAAYYNQKVTPFLGASTNQEIAVQV